MTTTKKLDELEKNKKAADAVSGGGALPVAGYKAPASQNQGAAGEQNPRVTALRQYLENTVGGTPTESDLLKNVRAQLMNRTGFTYDHNNDPRFKQFLETAKRSGKMAMQDTMGQAASLTGGYANSWAQTAGQTAFNDYLQDANEMIPEFEELARARYDAETAALGDQYAILKGEHDEALEDYWNRYSIAREDWYTEQDRQTAEKQYEDEKKQKEIELLLAMGDYGALDRMGYNTSSLRAQAAVETAATNEADEGSGLYQFMREEERKTADGLGYEKSGVMVFTDPNGKEIKLEKGINPYTRTKNADIDYGTFSNGYQPNHIVFSVVDADGKEKEEAVKLKATEDQQEVKGRNQTIWKTEYSGEDQYWLWDGEINDYVDVTADYKEYLKNKNK